jgi:hypothetical protein
MFFNPNYQFLGLTFSGRKGGNAVAVTKGTPHNHVDLPHLVSVEATAACMPIDNRSVTCSVYKSPSLA